MRQFQRGEEPSAETYITGGGGEIRVTPGKQHRAGSIHHEPSLTVRMVRKIFVCNASSYTEAGAARHSVVQTGHIGPSVVLEFSNYQTTPVLFCPSRRCLLKHRPHLSAKGA